MSGATDGRSWRSVRAAQQNWQNSVRSAESAKKLRDFLVAEIQHGNRVRRVKPEPQLGVKKEVLDLNFDDTDDER